MNHLKLCLIAWSLLLWHQVAVAQPERTKAERELETAVRFYNAYQDMVEGLKNGAVAPDEAKKAEEAYKKIKTGLAGIISNESGEIRRTALYFRTVSDYERALFLSKNKEFSKSSELVFELEPSFSEWDAGDFPLSYAYDEKTFKINYDNFAPTEASYYVALGELYQTQKGNSSKSIEYCRKSAQNNKATAFVASIANYYLLFGKDRQGQYDQESVDAALKLLKKYNSLSSEEKTTFQSFSPQVAPLAYNSLQKAATANPSYCRSGSCYGEAAPELALLGENNLAAQAYTRAIQAGYGSYAFFNEAVDIAHKTNDKNLGSLAADRLGKNAGDSDCAELRRISGLFDSFGNKSAASDYLKKADKCESARRKQERRQNGSGIGVYVGTYLIPLFNRDYGIAVNFRGSRWITELSYLKIPKKRDRLPDLWLADVDDLGSYKYYWDGYYAHIAFKKIMGGRRGTRPYSGVLLGYADKKFNTFSGTAVNDVDGSTVIADFSPTDKQYILMYNIGIHNYGRFFGSDAYFGLGPVFSQFDKGNDLYESGYSFTNNPLLENRKKNRIGLMIRCGLTIGLNAGR